MKIGVIKSGGPTDAQIIEEILLGRTDLFGLLFDRYAKKIFGYLWHFTDRREDCEDFLQETFYKAYVNLKYCRERTKFSSWLFSIAHNVAVSGLKKLSFYYRRELSLEDFVDVGEVASNEDLNLELVRQENIKKVRKALHGLPLRYKEVVLLFYYNELSLKEISETLAIPVNTVKTRLYRARHHLSQKLREPVQKSALDISLAKSNTMK